MTNPQKSPSKKQLRYLRDLAVGRGQTFTYPLTSSEASREIDRLRKVRPTSVSDRRRDDRAVSSLLSIGDGKVARIGDDELAGYGSTAAWAATTDEVDPS